jgi:hypothetical protein
MNHRDKIWFFAISNCDKSFSNLLNKGLKIEIEIRLINNGSNFSAEDAGFHI